MVVYSTLYYYVFEECIKWPRLRGCLLLAGKEQTNTILSILPGIYRIIIHVHCEHGAGIHDCMLHSAIKRKCTFSVKVLLIILGHSGPRILHTILSAVTLIECNVSIISVINQQDNHESIIQG